MTFNRTILELKQDIHHIQLLFRKPFNRTILELKQRAWHSIIDSGWLLIEPFWN